MLRSIRERLGLPLDPPLGAADYPSVEEAVEIALAAGVSVVSFAMGSPRPYVERVHAAGAVVVGTATTVAEAEEVEAAGADLVVAQGAEAGGHRSTFAAGRPDELPLIGTMALVPAVVDAVRVPVLAAGGIMDGRGIVAALALGAAGVQLGTRFLLATESGAPPSYRRQLLAADETSTLVTDVYSGRPARGIRNAFARLFLAGGTRPLPYPRQGAAAADIYRASLEHRRRVVDALRRPGAAAGAAGAARRRDRAGVDRGSQRRPEDATRPLTRHRGQRPLALSPLALSPSRPLALSPSYLSM